MPRKLSSGAAARPRRTTTTWFLIRREPLYHKLQYSKVPKYDPAAAVLGAAIGAFVGYLALGSVGSGGGDLSDLTTLVWYAGLWYAIAKQFLAQQRDRGLLARRGNV
jgi:hypothetical protein